MLGSFIWTNDQSGQYCPSYSRYTPHLSSGYHLPHHCSIIFVSCLCFYVMKLIMRIYCYSKDPNHRFTAWSSLMPRWHDDIDMTSIDQRCQWVWEEVVTSVQLGDCPSPCHSTTLAQNWAPGKSTDPQITPRYSTLTLTTTSFGVFLQKMKRNKKLRLCPPFLKEEDMTLGLVVNQATLLEYKAAITPLNTDHTKKISDNRLRPIEDVQFGFAHFLSHFIRVQIFQIDFPLILSVSKYFR